MSAYTRVQGKSTSASGVFTNTVTLTSTPTTGNKIILNASGAGSSLPTFTSVVDGNSNALTLVAQTTSATHRGAQYFYDVPATPSSTFTVTYSVGSDTGVIVEEWSGLAAGNTTTVLDGSAAIAAGTGASPSAGAYSSTASGELLIASLCDEGFSTTYTLPGGYTAETANINGSGINDMLACWKDSTGGAETATWGGGAGGNWVAILVAYKLAGGGAPTDPGSPPFTAFRPGFMSVGQFPAFMVTNFIPDWTTFQPSAYDNGSQSSSVTVSASAVLTSTTIGTAAISTGETASPTAISATTTIGTPVVGAGAGVNATAVQTSTTIGSPTVSTGETATTTAVPGSTTIGTASISTGETVAATAVQTSTTIGSPTVVAVTTVSPTAVQTSTTIGSPSISTGETVAATRVPASTTIGSPNVFSDATVNATAVSTSTTIGTASISTGETVSASAILATTTIGAAQAVTGVIVLNDFEKGTSGTTIAAAGSGGGGDTAFDTVTIAGTTSYTYDNAQAAHGALAGKITPQAAASSSFVEWNTAVGTSTEFWVRLYVYATANPAAQWFPWRAVDASNNVARMSITTAGKLRLDWGTGNTNTTVSTNAINLNGWTRIEIHIKVDASSGAADWRLFKTMDSTTADETQSNPSLAFTSTGATKYQFGALQSAATSPGTFWLDDIGISTNTWIGPVAGTDATVNASAVLATTTIGSPTINAGAGVNAVAISATTTIGSPTVNTGETVAATSVATSITIGTAQVSTGETVTTTRVPGSTTIGTPVVSGSSVATPTAIASTTTIGTASISTGSLVAANAVLTSVTIPVPAVSTGSNANINATSVPGSTTIGVVAISTGSTIAAVAILATTTIGTADVRTGETVTLTAIITTVTIGSPTITAVTQVFATSVPAHVTMGVPIISAGSTVLATAILASTLIGSASPRTSSTVSASSVLTFVTIPIPNILTAFSKQRIRISGTENDETWSGSEFNGHLNGHRAGVKLAPLGRVRSFSGGEPSSKLAGKEAGS